MDKHMQNSQKQSGFVAILTVIFFTLLMSVIAVGFLRLTVQERSQTLQDDLSKGAYQSAQAGVEDAKRAILYCSSLTGVAKTSCEASLYQTTCPGFNKDPDGVAPYTNYFNAIGIPASTSGAEGTQIGDATTRQGYSCVIVTRNTESLKGQLTTNTESDTTLLELRAIGSYTRIRIKWHLPGSDGTPFIPAAGTFVNATTTAGNPRLPHWPADSTTGTSAPAMLRIRTMAPQVFPFTVNDIRAGNFFVYPAASSMAPFGASTYKILDNYATQRYESKCVADETTNYDGYACAVDIEFMNAAGTAAAVASGNRYIVLQAMYRSTNYEITAYNGASTTPVLFDGVQPTIDSTGYTNGVYRRVKVGVRLGSESLATNAALDAGLGVCKDFRVGGVADSWLNNCD